MKKPKILWVSDSCDLPHIGQSIVSRECLVRLQHFYEVEQLGFGAGQVDNPIKVPFNIIPCLRSDMGDINKVSAFIEQSKPDAVILSHDIWLIPCIEELRARYPNIKFICYVTLDGSPAYWDWYRWLKSYDKLITPSNWSKQVLLDRWIDLNVDVVPYGVDHNLFHFPKQGKVGLKQQITESYAQSAAGWINLNNKFVGLYVGANQDRKNLGLIHEAWRIFEKGKEDKVELMMFVHSADLKHQIGSYDLSVFIHDTKTIRIINEPQPDSVIGGFTAAADILFHPSSGEGFGLTVAQAMACATVPVILPYAAVTDFCTADNSYGIPFIKHVGGYHTHRAVASAEEGAKVLEAAYTDIPTRIQKAENALRDAQKFTWDNTLIQLKSCIDQTLSYDRNSIYVNRVN